MKTNEQAMERVNGGGKGDHDDERERGGGEKKEDRGRNEEECNIMEEEKRDIVSMWWHGYEREGDGAALPSKRVPFGSQ